MTTSAEGITARECLVARTQSLIQDITRRIEEGGEINSNTQDYLLYRSDVLYQHVVRLCSLEGSEDLYTDITSKLREVITIIRNEGENSEESTNYRVLDCVHPSYYCSFWVFLLHHVTNSTLLHTNN